MEQKLKEFFSQYAARFNEALAGRIDVEATVAAFADCFVEANPTGINCGQNNKEFREVIPKGYQFYKSIGLASMTILSDTVTLLDDLHAMVKIHWQARYTRKDNKPDELIAFEVTYFLQLRNGTPKIFAYITGDEQKVLREHGLV